MGYRSKQGNLNRRISNGLATLKEMSNIFNHEGNANQKGPETPSPFRMAKIITQVTAHAGKDVELRNY